MTDRRDPALSVVIPTFNNVQVLSRCIDSWRTYAAGEPVELIVIEDGCRDATADYLTEQAASEWGRRHLRWYHENNVHELRSTNRGLSEACAPLIMTWHDDMFVRQRWFVRELLETFAGYPELGLLCLSRGLICVPCEDPIERWDDLIDWKRLESTIGPRPFNWFRLQEVDAVIRPWVVRRVCLDRVGSLDEAFIPTGWDEADLSFRIRQAGWKVAVHGYERAGAFVHLGSSTFTKFGLNIEQDLRNGRVFHDRWDETIRVESARTRKTWWRRTTAIGWVQACQQLGRFTLPWTRPIP